MYAVKQRLTEDQFIAAIVAALGRPARRLRLGIGDDAAVWKPKRSHLSLISTDALSDGVHFRSELTTPQALGHKALAQSLSDVAAMGGRAVLCVVALGVTEVVDERWASAFYGGMAALARHAGCAIAGGDIFRSPVLTVAVTVVGEARASHVRLRSGARAGDYACVTGPLGLAAAGLTLVQASRSSVLAQASKPSVPVHVSKSTACDREAKDVLRRAYEMPTPRLPEGIFLGSMRAVHALMDLSDGLSLDLARMAKASQVDAYIDLDALKPARFLANFPEARELMLHGGDDYELLSAVESRALTYVARRFRSRFKRELMVVGRFEKGQGKIFALSGGVRSELAPRGYDHFERMSREI